MTTPLVPDFILNLFQEEIKKINLKLLQTFCEEYDVKIEDAKKKLGQRMNVCFDLSHNEKIVLVRKQRVVEPEQRCIARVFNKKNLEVFQCTRRKSAHSNGNDDDCDFCKMHQRMFDEDRLKYGTINDEVPHEISSPVLSKKKKNKIY